LLERVVNSDTNNTHAYFNLGLANLFLEDYKKSIAFFSKALRTKESGGFLLDKKYGQENEIPFIEIVYWRGIASYYNDSIEQSISDFNTCINLNFKTGDSYLYQGYNFVKRNDLKNACICFGEALRHGNNDAAPFKQKYCR